MEQSEERQKRMKEYRRLFLEEGVLSPEVRPMVRESWKRCQAYGNHSGYKIDKISGAGLNQLLEEHRALIDTAHPILMKLVDAVGGTQYAVTLHERNGRIIDHLFAGDHPIFSIEGYKLGVRWEEDTIGTCSSALAMREDQPVQLEGYEHYSERIAVLIGTAAPIHDFRGKVIGCLNMCGYYTSGTTHTLGLVTAMAMLIESEMETKRTRRLLQDTYDLVPAGMLILDTDYRITQISFPAAAIFQQPQKAMYGTDFSRYFQDEDFKDRLMRGNSSFSYTEYEMVCDGKSIFCNVEVVPMMTEGERTGILVILRESRNVRQLANKITGNRASYSFHDIITHDSEMLLQMDTMRDIASTDCCILIEGESGCGKELFAHSIHNASVRRKGPFVAVNCAALPRSLVESELFGYEKGAFTGARNEGSPGKFELAEGGTIFLDEIGELPLEIQATLLRVLDSHKVVRIGGKQEKSLDVRVIAATNRCLYQEVQEGNFRNDLYFRLNVLKFEIPPLRMRHGDVELLAETFLERLNERQEGQRKEFSAEALSVLAVHSWPGNVRELQNVVVRAYYASKGAVITPDALPQEVRKAQTLPEPAEKETKKAKINVLPVYEETEKTPIVTAVSDLEAELAEMEVQKIVNALRKTGGDVPMAAMEMGISRATMYRRMKKYGILQR